MTIGNKILELRKKNNLSQEELANKLGVARQTISKWELSETSPDLKQATSLSKLFNVSLDELVGNKENTSKKSNSKTEKLAGIILTIMKIETIILVIIIITVLLFKTTKSKHNDIIQEYIICNLENETHAYWIRYNKDTKKIKEMGGDTFLYDTLKLNKYDDASEVFNTIDNYVKNKNGTCEMNKEYDQNEKSEDKTNP